MTTTITICGKHTVTKSHAIARALGWDYDECKRGGKWGYQERSQHCSPALAIATNA